MLSPYTTTSTTTFMLSYCCLCCYILVRRWRPLLQISALRAQLHSSGQAMGDQAEAKELRKYLLRNSRSLPKAGAATEQRDTDTGVSVGMCIVCVITTTGSRKKKCQCRIWTLSTPSTLFSLLCFPHFPLSFLSFLPLICVPFQFRGFPPRIQLGSLYEWW